MSKASKGNTAKFGGEVIQVDADGFPLAYELDSPPADVAAQMDAAASLKLSDPTTPAEIQTVSDATTTEAAPAATDATPTTTPVAPDSNGTAPAVEKTAKPKSGRKPFKVPSPTNNPPPAAATANGSTPKGGGKKGGAKPDRTQASVAYGKFAGAKPPPETDAELPLSELTRDRRVQMRASLTDNETVQKYSDLYADDPNILPPIRVIEIPESERETLGLTSRFVVWDGFQRSEARKQAGMKTIPVKLAQGTWELVRRLALSANASHGLPRTFADLRKAFQAILDDDDMKDAILAEGKGNGGGTIALARAIGASTGYVFEVLRSMGLQVRGDKIVKRPAEPAKPAGPAPVDYAAEATRSESQAAIKSKATAAIVHEMQWAIASVQRRYYELIDRDDARTLLPELAASYGVPLAEHETPDGPQKDGEPTKTVKQTYWPAVDHVLMTLDRMKEEHGKMNVSTTGNAATSPGTDATAPPPNPPAAA